jgi:hypothetical protein
MSESEGLVYGGVCPVCGDEFEDGYENREENLELVEKGAHGAADGTKSECGYTHKDYLRALVSEPPEWAQNVVDDAEY